MGTKSKFLLEEPFSLTDVDEMDYEIIFEVNSPLTLIEN